MMKHTILFLAANPSLTDRLALDQEARSIGATIQWLKADGFTILLVEQNIRPCRIAITWLSIAGSSTWSPMPILRAAWTDYACTLESSHRPGRPNLITTTS